MRGFYIFLFFFASESYSSLYRCPMNVYDQYKNNVTAWGKPPQQMTINPSCCDSITNITIFIFVESDCYYTACWFNQIEHSTSYTKYPWANYQICYWGNQRTLTSCQHGPSECTWNRWLGTSCTLYSTSTNMKIAMCHYQYVLNRTASDSTVKNCIDKNGGNSAFVVLLANSPYGTQTALNAQMMTNQVYNRTGTPFFVKSNIRKQDNINDNNVIANGLFDDIMCNEYQANQCKTQCQN